MKRSILLASIFMFSLFIVACGDDDDQGSGPSDNNPPANSDPAFTAIISGDVVDTISFTVPGGIFTDYSILGSYSSVAQGLLSINAMELPNGFSISLIGNRDSYGIGDFTASGIAGYGAYVDAAQGRTFIGTAATVTISSSELLQNVVDATYEVNGSFSITMEDTSTPPREIEVNGTFENITLQVN